MNAPRTGAEREAWRIASSAGAWRPPPHPRFTDRRPALDWAAARGSHADEPWPAVRACLGEIEAGARAATPEKAEDDDGR